MISCLNPVKGLTKRTLCLFELLIKDDLEGLDLSSQDVAQEMNGAFTVTQAGHVHRQDSKLNLILVFRLAFYLECLKNKVQNRVETAENQKMKPSLTTRDYLGL